MENKDINSAKLDGKGWRILFVEDDPFARWVVRKGMENAGHLVTDADSCERAISLVDTMVFDAVVLDHRLPDGVGLDILRRIRDRQLTYKAVYLTAEAEKITEQIKHDLDIAFVLTKPVEMAQLAQGLREAMSGADTDVSPCAVLKSEFDDSTLQRTGHFVKATLAPVLTADAVDDLIVISETEPWLALDISETKGIAQDSMAGLSALARKCRISGGRLCFVGGGEDIKRQIADTALFTEADLYPDASWLEPAGRHPTSVCERAAVLESVIREERQ